MARSAGRCRGVVRRRVGGRSPGRAGAAGAGRCKVTCVNQLYRKVLPMAPRRETVVELVDEMSLLIRAARAMVQHSSVRLDMPVPLLGVLWALYTHGALRQNQLAERLCISESALSRQIAALAADGLVERTRSEEDGRVSLVQISDVGRERMKVGLEHRVDDYAPKFAAWSDEQTREALDTVARLRRAIAAE
ncbi:MarR family transcriptional regulator [Gordonia pseudamarae]|nr:MarR family transcriptional regulator [Gordonia pseudamarae]